ncbi:MAG: DUF3795 domain-containing protein [Treponemataceae bacterium]|nr:DUF3795 domain-containing protein [Treponemataceae bacterium]
MEKITLCGDDCLQCPRYLAKTEEEKNCVAELWHRIGWRDKIVSPEEISCEGCSSHKKCTYNLVECVKENGVEKCNQCSQFPCEKIKSMLERSAEYKKKCKKLCTREEYAMLEKSFFRKEENLRK